MQANPEQSASTLDALAVATFIDIGRQVDRDGDTLRAELYYKQAVRAAEQLYGENHGEVGLVLMRLAAFYRNHARYAEMQRVEQRITEITELYKYDLED